MAAQEKERGIAARKTLGRREMMTSFLTVEEQQWFIKNNGAEHSYIAIENNLWFSHRTIIYFHVTHRREALKGTSNESVNDA